MMLPTEIMGEVVVAPVARADMVGDSNDVPRAGRGGDVGAWSIAGGAADAADTGALVVSPAPTWLPTVAAPSSFRSSRCAAVEGSRNSRILI